jgi:N-acetylglucosamine-6-phosphate deacetylase
MVLGSSQAAEADLYVNTSTGLILSAQPNLIDSRTRPQHVIDLGGDLLAPGLIDTQINGAYGVDFSELNAEAADGGEAEYVQGLEEVARRIVETGCTSFLPTILTQRENLYTKVRSRTKGWPEQQLLRLLIPRSTPGSAHALGYHAEGPFLHPSRRGIHAEALLMDAPGDTPVRSLERVYGKGGLDQPGVKLITLAPDVEGIMQCIPSLASRGVTISIGHRWVYRSCSDKHADGSDASLEIATKAVEKGARMITHLFK